MPIAGGLAVVPSGDSSFALVGLLLAEVHPEFAHQGYLSGSVSSAAMLEAPVPTVSTLLSKTAKSSCLLR
jgi:hypothetical protein